LLRGALSSLAGGASGLWRSRWGVDRDKPFINQFAHPHYERTHRAGLSEAEDSTHE